MELFIFMKYLGYRMDTSIFCITLCLLLERHVIGQWLVSNRVDVIVNASSQYDTSGTWDINHIIDGSANTDANLCKCCGGTALESNPWFNVDLSKEYIIQRIHVLGRTDHPHYLRYMEIKLGTTESSGTVLQGVNTSDTDLREFDYTLPSPELARFISFTLRDIENIFIICELYVYAACYEGTYGQECVNKCGTCLNNEPCDDVTGECSECISGYNIPLCKDCIDHRYGQTCNERCGHCNNNDVCDKSNGSCPRECFAGYQGTNCKEVCSWGKYGLSCTTQCGRCENNATCNNVDGNCTACSTGYLAPLCKDCNAGRYGTTCEECGHCNNTDVCDKNNGNCLGGCSAGYQGNTCTEAATKLTFPRGYSAGYKGNICREECEDANYGLGCQYKCGNCSDNAPCNNIDGGCTACAAGYKGNTCLDECQAGTFGFNCKQRCGMCQDGDVCDIYTGECPNGCTDEYKGSRCSQEINQDTSTCADPCISLPVFIGSMFSVIVVNTTSVIGLVWLFYRKRSNKNTDKAANSKDPSIPLPNTPSNYDTLKFDNPGGESTYTELNRRS